VDEARDDNLYELEIALNLLPADESVPPWQVDRVLRNFLVDLTGNTHRSEFCIDKLYSPDNIGGRRGLVEFRSFEMPPHARMSAVQMLLLRCLVAHFWNHPYKHPLIRWGTDLHDRFMLPHYVWEDFKQVIRDLRNAGFEFEVEWFAPFCEFRFPRIGTIHALDMQLDLHTALEPWHVLGEEATGQSTARFVDSSVERLQVSVHNMAGNRYIVTCNGRRAPLRTTGISGYHVAGVRYKAWQPYSSLHPTIKAHTPLIFDIVDTENCRSIGGCTYHVAHPGGRHYETFPVNANEAEARRSARFWPYGYTQGRIMVPQEELHAEEQPYVLDLRFPITKKRNR
ncbi:MAG: transglutaminase family protein, partial [Gammaproteobacteria bacterium]|nr:transglutaminase family protein [Gammaproteobacteria bacterium]